MSKSVTEPVVSQVMTFAKSTPGTHVYQCKESNLQSVYLKKGIFPKDSSGGEMFPAAIHITVTATD